MFQPLQVGPKPSIPLMRNMSRLKGRLYTQGFSGSVGLRASYNWIQIVNSWRSNRLDTFKTIVFLVTTAIAHEFSSYSSMGRASYWALDWASEAGKTVPDRSV